MRLMQGKIKIILMALLVVVILSAITMILISNNEKKEFIYRTKIKDSEIAEYFEIPDILIINDAKDALAIGTIILKANFAYLTDPIKSKNIYYDIVEIIAGDEKYWKIYAYYELRGYDVYGQCATVIFRKSDCQIVDMGMR